MKKFLATVLALASFATAFAFAACDNDNESQNNNEQQQGTYYVPEDGAVYLFSECKQFDVVTDGQTSSMIDMAKEVYADCTLTFSDDTLIMAYSLQVEDGIMTYEYNGEVYECTIVNDISAQLGAVQELSFTVTADELIIYSHVTVANNDGHHTEQFGEMVFVRQN